MALGRSPQPPSTLKASPCNVSSQPRYVDISLAHDAMREGGKRSDGRFGRLLRRRRARSVEDGSEDAEIEAKVRAVTGGDGMQVPPALVNPTQPQAVSADGGAVDA